MHCDSNSNNWKPRYVLNIKCEVCDSNVWSAKRESKSTGCHVKKLFTLTCNLYHVLTELHRRTNDVNKMRGVFWRSDILFQFDTFQMFLQQHRNLINLKIPKMYRYNALMYHRRFFCVSVVLIFCSFIFLGEEIEVW